MKLRPIFRCEGCGYWEPRPVVILTPPVCPFCRTDERGRHATSTPNDEGRPAIARRRWRLWPAVRKEPVLPW